MAYFSKKTDTAASIALRNGMTVQQLIKLNPGARNLVSGYGIAGQMLVTQHDVKAAARPKSMQTLAKIRATPTVPKGATSVGEHFDFVQPKRVIRPKGSGTAVETVVATPAPAITTPEWSFQYAPPNYTGVPSEIRIPEYDTENGNNTGGGFDGWLPDGSPFDGGDAGQQEPPLLPGQPGHEDPRTAFQTQSSKMFLKGVLERYGLGGLVDWAWQQIGLFRPDEEILLDLREQDSYRQRFPGMRGREANGHNAISEEEYLSIETAYHQIMRASGLPPEFYDSNEDFTQFINNNTSPLELTSRIQDGYRRVAQTDPAVRAAFEEFYGGATDAALATMFLDPVRGADLLVKMARTAEVAGIGRRSGVAIGMSQSEEIAAFEPPVSQINAGFSQVGSQADLERETFGEYNNLQAGDLISAAFNTSGALEARQKIRKRRDSRMAAFSGGGGAAFFQGQGFIGTGTADS